jgi:hypothetical protein
MKKGEQNRKKRDADLRKINRLEVVHLVRDEGVAGSNPATPTTFSFAPIAYAARYAERNHFLMDRSGVRARRGPGRHGHEHPAAQRRRDRYA